MTRLLLIAAMLALSFPASALDEGLYAEILQRHTQDVKDIAGVRVDYRALRDEADWNRLVASVENTELGSLGSRAAKIAFWSNAYNILTIETVVRNYPLRSIKDVGSLFRSVWKREAGKIGTREVSLAEIEHKILRPMGEPRFHAAIVCASLSCPPLRREPYTEENLEAELDEAMRTWLADPRKGIRILREKKTVQVSKIFDWFEEDFDAAGGVLAFIAPFIADADRAWLEQNAAEIRVEYLYYDWRLNGLDR